MPNKPITPLFIRRQLRLRLARFWRNLYTGFSDEPRGLPGFIIIGAQKAGTTSLFKYLRQHPAVAPAYKKEIKYFDCNYRKGLDWYRSHFPYASSLTDGKVTGEASPHTIFHPLAPRRIAETLPVAAPDGVRLIALLRNPIARAYSHYQLNVRRRREMLSFEQAIEQEPERLSGMLAKIQADEDIPLYNFLHYSYLSKGLYADQLQNWLNVFPREHILILKSEDFFNNPPATFQQTLQFLGLPTRELKKYEHYNSGSYSGMKPETAQHLKEYFRPHNQNLYDLLGVDYGWDSMDS